MVRRPSLRPLGHLLTGLAALLFLAACAPAALPERTFQVSLSEWTIGMPSTMPASQATFEVTNTGSVEHNFRIQGNGVDRTFETNLQPGERKVMTVRLEPGVYRVYCPIGGHAGQGMDRRLTVTD